jgi:hypothetical protein
LSVLFWFFVNRKGEVVHFVGRGSVGRGCRKYGRKLSGIDGR